MSKILVFRNQSEIDSTVRNFNDHVSQYQSVINEFNDLGIGQIENRDQFFEAVNNPRQFIQVTLTAKIEREPVVVAGIRLKADKLMEMMDISEVNEFVKAADRAKAASHFFQRVGNIDKAGRVFQDNELLKQYTEQNTIYATSDRQKEIYKALQQIVDAMEALRDAGANGDFPHLRMTEIMTDVNSRYELSPRYFTKIAGQ